MRITFRRERSLFVDFFETLLLFFFLSLCNALLCCLSVCLSTPRTFRAPLFSDKKSQSSSLSLSLAHTSRDVGVAHPSPVGRQGCQIGPVFQLGLPDWARFPARVARLGWGKSEPNLAKVKSLPLALSRQGSHHSPVGRQGCQIGPRCS